LTEIQLLENQEFRNSVIEHYEVLEKVKELLLIPNTEFATIKQVAEFYEVGEEAVKAIVFRFKKELEPDGMVSKNGSETKEFLVSCNLQPTNHQGYFSIENINFAYKSNTFFPRRAILRVGMLLRDSAVAVEVRTQLLNIEEKTSLEIKTADIEEEQSLALAVGMAHASGDINALSIATAKMMDFKNRHIKKLETTNKALANGILEWEDRDRLNFAVRKLSYSTGIHYAKMWNELYKQLVYKYGIDLKKRGDKPYIANVKENEWSKVIKSFSALCKHYGYEPEEIFCDLEVK